jgi:hypothetical protein
MDTVEIKTESVIVAFVGFSRIHKQNSRFTNCRNASQFMYRALNIQRTYSQEIHSSNLADTPVWSHN